MGIVCIEIVLKVTRGGERNKGVTLNKEEAQRLSPEALQHVKVKKIPLTFDQIVSINLEFNSTCYHCPYLSPSFLLRPTKLPPLDFSQFPSTPNA